MTIKPIKRLLIIGNGFDLAAGRKSTFADFANTDEDLIKLKSLFDKLCDVEIKIPDGLPSPSDDSIYGIKSKDSKKTDNINWLEYFVRRLWADKNFNPMVYDTNTANPFDFATNKIYRALYPDNSLFREFISVQQGKPINFFKIVMLLKQRSKDSSSLYWEDIERTLKEILLFAENFHLNHKRKIPRPDRNNLFDDPKIPTFEKSYLVLAEVFSHFGKSVPAQHKKNTQASESFFHFLERSLKDFECDFADYLKNSVTDTSNYNSNVYNLRAKIAENDYSNILTFNYTSQPQGKLTRDKFANIIHVHGKLEDSIVLGIDQEGISPELPMYKFTKTFRLMSNPNREPANQSILADSIKTIAFFGHSLNPSDYSYFQSIFDYYNIYSNPITLKFFTIPFLTNSEKEEYEGLTSQEKIAWNKQHREKRAMINALKISRLLAQYGSTLTNKDHGKNLEHKLLLENRLFILDVPSKAKY